MSRETWWAALREWTLRAKGVVRWQRSDGDLAQELESHLELAEEALRRQGHSATEAARLARVRAGRPAHALEPLRAQRGIPSLSALWLDTKLGLRVLRKQWGLTVVGGFAMTLAIALAASAFDFLNAISGTSIPLPEGDRLVIIQPWDQEAGQEHPSSLEDFERWRDQLQSVVDVGAFRTVHRSLTTSDGPVGDVSIAEMSAAGFRAARVAPLVGRALDDGDERADAPPVVVIGYQIWQSRFHGDPAAVGRRVRLGGDDPIVVGVMPKDFGFPLNHGLWIPLRHDPAARTVDDDVGEQDARVIVFARLAPHASLAAAHAEVSAAGLVDRDAVSRAGKPLKPRVVPYVYGIYGGEDLWLIHLVQMLLVLVVVPPCANIAVLVYARMMSRQGEFALRSALGASRSRLASQVFVELFLLAVVSAGLALAIGRKVVSLLRGPFAQQAFGGMPFWMDFSLSYATILYVIGLAVVAAAIAGVIPSLRATGRWKQAVLQDLSSRSAPRLGWVWTAIVALQVGLSVAALPAALEFGWWNLRSAVLGPGFAAGRFMTGRLSLEAPPAGEPGNSARFTAVRADFTRQLAAESDVSALSLSRFTPTAEPIVRVDVEEPGHGFRQVRVPVRANLVDEAFFRTLDVPLLTGRGFSRADIEANPPAVVVNRTFVERILGPGNALGRRVRMRRTTETSSVDSEPWLDIVGVVADLRTNGTGGPTLYRPLSPDMLSEAVAAGQTRSIRSGQPGTQEVSLTIRTNAAVLSGSQDLARRLQVIATAAAPGLRLDGLRTMHDIYQEQIVGDILGGSALLAVMLGILMVSVAGVYTLLSFTVTQRRREIAVRAALGASPLRLLTGIFRRVLAPISAGAAAGSLVALFLERVLSVVFLANVGLRPLPWILPVVVLSILVLGALVLAGPARRAIRLHPTEALREG